MVSILLRAASALLFVPNVQAVQIVQEVRLDAVPAVRAKTLNLRF
jgi:hypothetical protein